MEVVDVVEIFELERRYREGRLLGARITLRFEPGTPQDWVEQRVACHVALHGVVDDMPRSPLAVRGARATVREERTLFVVEVTSDDARVAAEILRRALGDYPVT